MDFTPIISTLKWSHRDLTYSFMQSAPLYFQNDKNVLATFVPITGAMQAEFKAIFTPAKNGDALRPTYFSDISLLTFSLASGTGDLAIGSFLHLSQAPASAQLPHPYAYGGDIYLGLDFTSPSPPGDHKNFVLLHEIGHALGLEHGNVYPPSNSVPSLPHLAPQFDSMKYTIMSYNPDPNAAIGKYPVGLQQFDIAHSSRCMA